MTRLANRNLLFIMLMLMLAVSCFPAFVRADTVGYASATKTLNLYMRSDLYNVSDVTAYGLDVDYTNSHVALPVTSSLPNASVTYGFRVYLVASSASSTELSSGSPVAPITVSGNFTGQLSSSWNFPGANVVLGEQALEVVVYAKINSGSWSAIASFVTNVLMTDELVASTWVFTLQLSMVQEAARTTCTVYFGDSSYRCSVNGVTYAEPSFSDIQLWQWMNGDFIGLIVGGYVHVLGGFFYVLVYVMLFGSLWLRHRGLGPVVFLAVMLGGVGGLSVWAVLGQAYPLAAAVLSVFIILALMALIFKVIR